MGKIYLTDDTIEARKQKYEIAVNPIKSFLDIAVAEDSVSSDKIGKDLERIIRIDSSVRPLDQSKRYR